ncbi:unnamed protein product, partial [Notodromas monacha]
MESSLQPQFLLLPKNVTLAKPAESYVKTIGGWQKTNLTSPLPGAGCWSPKSASTDSTFMMLYRVDYPAKLDKFLELVRIFQAKKVCFYSFDPQRNPRLERVCNLYPTQQPGGGDMPNMDLVNWADGFVLVYSITDRNSFSFIKQVKQFLVEKRGVAGPQSCANGGSPSTSTSSLSSFSSSFSFQSPGGTGSGGVTSSNQSPLPIAIIGNKGDMVHLRQVSTEEEPAWQQLTVFRNRVRGEEQESGSPREAQACMQLSPSVYRNKQFLKQ